MTRTNPDVKIRPTLYTEHQEIILQAINSYAQEIWREYHEAMQLNDKTDATPFMARFRVASDTVEVIQKSQALERSKLGRGEIGEDE